MEHHKLTISKKEMLAFRASRLLIILGILLSAPFSFYPKSEFIALAAFISASAGLAMGGSLRRVTKAISITHGIAIFAAFALFFYHKLDLLYIKFVLSLIISFQLCILDRRILLDLRDIFLHFGSRGAALAIVSFALYFAFDLPPFFRTQLADERSLPFFGVTNINFGFDNPEIIIFARPAFLFDEPGQFAHFVVLLLAIIATSGAPKGRWRTETALLVFAGFATFSLAFFVVASIYLVTKIQKPGAWLLVLGIAIAGYLLSDHPLMEALQWRLTSVEDRPAIDSRGVSGDNRSREVEMAFEAFSENIVWGAGWTQAERSIGHFAANIVGPLGYSGLMAIFLYLPLLARLYRSLAASRGFYQLLVVGLVALFFSQRPYFYFPVFILLMEFLRYQIETQKRPSPTVRSAAKRPRRRRSRLTLPSTSATTAAAQALPQRD